MAWWRSILIWMVVTIILVVVFNSTDLRAKNMDAETFFTGQLLTAYHLAKAGNTNHLVQLAKAGTDLNRPGKDDMTLLGLAVVTADRRAIASLMRAGANPNQVIPDAGSPAILAITKHYAPPHTAAIEGLLDGGYNPNQLLGEGKPYLFFFVDYNHWPGLQLALQRGGDINVRRNNGKSLLTYVIESGHYAQARGLIAEGADVAARGERDETALRAIESKIRKCSPSMQNVWKELLSMRELILSKLPDPKDRHTFFTDVVEQKIRQNR